MVGARTILRTSCADLKLSQQSEAMILFALGISVKLKLLERIMCTHLFSWGCAVCYSKFMLHRVFHRVFQTRLDV
jgi:hypothetical protein